MSNQVINFVALGRPVEGLQLGEEAVGILHRLAADHPDAHQPELARALSSVAITLITVGRIDDAETMQATVIKIWRELADRHPKLYQRQLADANEQAAMFAEIVATVRAGTGIQLHVAPEIKERFGQAGVREIVDSLFPADCQSCGRPLTADGAALHVNDLLDAAEGSLHHRSCRPSTLNRPVKEGILRVPRSDGGLSWRSQTAITPFADATGRIRRIATVILNPALEKVWAYEVRPDIWQVRPHGLFVRAGMVPTADFHFPSALSGVSAHRQDDEVEIRVQGWPSAFLVPYADPAFLRATEDHRESFLLVVTHAADPSGMRRMAELRDVLSDHRTLVGTVRLDT